MPTIYFVLAAFLMKLVPYDLTQFPLWPAFTYAKNGLVSIALFSLGVQLSQTKLKLTNPDVYISVLTRLIGGPVIALLLISLFGINGVMAQVLMISSGLPTAVNTALISVECKNHPEFASQTVMLSTILASVSLTGVIYLSGVLFPV
jgi:predicted permease